MGITLPIPCPFCSQVGPVEQSGRTVGDFPEDPFTPDTGRLEAKIQRDERTIRAWKLPSSLLYRRLQKTTRNRSSSTIDVALIKLSYVMN